MGVADSELLLVKIIINAAWCLEKSTKLAFFYFRDEEVAIDCFG